LVVGCEVYPFIMVLVEVWVFVFAEPEAGAEVA
jgi:hypothetical protein